MTERLTIGTRGSALALVQTHWVRDELQKLYPSLDIHVLIIQTSGDRSQAFNTPLSSYAEKGIFAKELEAALLDREIDMAVHSMKDLAATLPPGLLIAAVPKRENAADALLGRTLEELKPGQRIGTGSVRRSALLRRLRPDLQIVDIRGNVDTRISKMKNGQYDAIVLAVAGLTRLGRTGEIAEVLDPHMFVPDAGQGALAVQTRVDDHRVNRLVAALNHADTRKAITAERAFLEAFGGGCQTPVGAWARMEEGTFKMTAMAALDGNQPKMTNVEGHVDEPSILGKMAARSLLGGMS